LKTHQAQHLSRVKPLIWALFKTAWSISTENY
jgi:hypothetical protein